MRDTDTGKYFLNPALTGRAFLFFAFPAYMSGDAAWTAVDGFAGATPLGIGATDGLAGIGTQVTWWDAFGGTLQGSLVSTSTLAILLGAAFLHTRVASWRIMAGCVAGLLLTVMLLNLIGSDANPMFGIPWYWHLVLGGFAFGTVYMATDPVSAAMTNTGRIAYGVLIGFMTALLRVVNPAFPEGILLENGITGAPVLDKLGNLIGFLSEKDCLEVALNASYHEDWGGTVGEFMTPRRSRWIRMPASCTWPGCSGTRRSSRCR